MEENAAVLRTAFVRPVPAGERYTDRLEEELSLIGKNKFVRVFLQVQRIMGLCKELVIPHVLRGSAGSSLVCYLMGISHTDPILYDMDLTRFMNVGRTDIPDIDIDVPYNRRNELYARIGATWPGQAARISNHVLYQYRSALQEAIRVHAPGVKYRKGASIDELVGDPELVAVIKGAVNDTIGTFRTDSLHCGGIVIFEKEGGIPRDLVLKEDGILPQIRLNKDETEDAGYIKIDLLSNRGLAQWWEASGGVRTLLSYKEHDAKVATLFASGATIGVTFSESRGMRQIYRRLKPTGVDEIAIALGLIRPAAAIGGRKTTFLKNYTMGYECMNDLERPIVYDDDALTRIRAALTYGDRTMPKETLDSLADYFRKAFAKQRTGDCLRFRDLCRVHGIPEPVLKILIDDLNQLQHYSFCKSHALSYAQLVWALAHEKAHNPYAFWVATLNHCHSDYRRWVHWREARTAGLRLTRGDPPYRLGFDVAGLPVMISEKRTQTLLIPDEMPLQVYTDMKERGYWLSKTFFPGCYKRVTKAPQKLLKATEGVLGALVTEYVVHFCGLIATGRVVRLESEGEESMETGHARAITFVCLGYENGKYLDMVVHGAKGGLLGFAAVEGTAKTRDPEGEEGLEVTKIRGVPLKVLVGR